MFWSGQADRSTALRQAVCRWALAIAVGSGLAAGAAVQARPAAPSDQAASVSLEELPVPAQKTYRLIRSGGPFPYSKDASVFSNRERLLPPKTRGYYREYTVPTPGARNRGARRIVCGGVQPTVPDACFYTADHYASFRRIAAADAR
ncbi:ribonuclease domain-containing protein [Rubrivivax gelatinosus]|uniref:Ribonuclease N1 n=1 Tax=Rubrivivax gelatinosus TaxID=28068 RepID=A0ABS1DR26_RUBGE|nr:ribonuclease N1 [Rubrivivax gelatinosus]